MKKLLCGAMVGMAAGMAAGMMLQTTGVKRYMRKGCRKARQLMDCVRDAAEG